MRKRVTDEARQASKGKGTIPYSTTILIVWHGLSLSPTLRAWASFLEGFSPSG